MLMSTCPSIPFYTKYKYIINNKEMLVFYI